MTPKTITITQTEDGHLSFKSGFNHSETIALLELCKHMIVGKYITKHKMLDDLEGGEE